VTETKKAESPRTDVKLAFEVSKEVELAAVLLKSASVESNIDEGASIGTLDTKQHFKARYELPGSDKIRVFMTFSLNLIEKDSGKEVLRLTAEFVLSYRVPEGKEYSPESLQHFSELNGTLHLWPYWRELVHTVVARVGLGSITLPVYRVKARNLDETKSEKESAKA
jgi:hypothetical protein